MTPVGVSVDSPAIEARLRGVASVVLCDTPTAGFLDAVARAGVPHVVCVEAERNRIGMGGLLFGWGGGRRPVAVGGGDDETILACVQKGLRALSVLRVGSVVDVDVAMRAGVVSFVDESPRGEEGGEGGRGASSKGDGDGDGVGVVGGEVILEDMAEMTARVAVAGVREGGGMRVIAVGVTKGNNRVGEAPDWDQLQILL